MKYNRFIDLANLLLFPVLFLTNIQFILLLFLLLIPWIAGFPQFILFDRHPWLQTLNHKIINQNFIFCVVLQFSTLSYRKSDNSPCTLLLALGVFFLILAFFSLVVVILSHQLDSLLCCPPAPPLTSLLACIICVWSRWYILFCYFFVELTVMASTLSHRLDSFMIKFLGFKQGVSTPLLVNRRRGSFHWTVYVL